MSDEEASKIRHCFDVKGRDESSFSMSQSQRRQQMLAKQRERKQNLAAKVRQLAMQNFEIEEEDSAKQDVSMGEQRKSEKIAEFSKNELMHHEPLEEIPIDLEENWVCFSIPAGKRCLVVASGSCTVARSLEGEVIGRFTSYLPGGSTSTQDGRLQSYSVFDCIFHQETNTFCVIDMMCWKANLYYDCDTEFRLFFLASKLSEIPYVKNITQHNPFRFANLPVFPCTRDGIQNAITPSVIGYNPDTVYFYNKESHYTAGQSNPLACYLPASKIESLFESGMV